LPRSTQSSAGTVEIHPHKSQPQEQREAQARDIPKILVAEDRPISHPITLLIEMSFHQSKKSEWGLIAPEPLVEVPMHVSARQLSRALRICDALLVALEQAGHKVAWPPPYNESLKVTVLGEPMTFLLSEVLERTAHKLTNSEVLRQKRESWWQAPTWDYEPSGRLMLTIEYGESLGVRRSWSDGKRKRIEDILGEFLVSVTAVAKAVKRRREEIDEWHRKWEEERKRQEELAARRAEYERKAKLVTDFIRGWEHGKSLRAFAEKLCSAADQAGIPEEQRRDIRSMTEWAMRQAGFIDPFADLARAVQQFKGPQWK
jgi:hypothetical protein